MPESERITVALTLEQCWHRVPGGTAVAGLGMARALAARNAVEVIGVAAAHHAPPPAPWVPPICVQHLSLPRIALYESWHRLRRPSVERATGPIDLIHATALTIPPRTAPLVVTIHDLAWLDAPQNFTSRGVGFFDRALRIAKEEADLVLSPSRATKDACVEYGFEKERVRVLPLGVDVDPVTPDEILRVKRNYELERPYVLWTGTIEPRKNLPGLLRAFRRIKAPVDLVLAGPAGWNEDLDPLMKDQAGRIKALGFVPPEDLTPLYAGAVAFCWPSFLEGFGFPVLEAMAQGTPVVTSRGTSTEEIAHDAGILVDPRDPAAIAHGIERIISDEGLARELAVKGRERAAAYSWDRTGELLEAAYREVIA